jgi:uncharacterized protein YbaP (TraB family)
MRYLLASALLLFVFLTVTLCGMAQTGRPSEPSNTLLWRIQGKQPGNTCYLYGTMHIKNKKVFYFSDSLYAALEGAEGFAMEVHPDSMVAMLFRHTLEERREQMVRDILTKAEMAKLDVKTKKELGIGADKLTTKDAYLLKERLSLPAESADDMQTFMDAYLYSIARDRQKRIAGLERPEDQEVILEDMETKFDPRTLVNDNGEGQRFTANMIDVYAKGNLGQLTSIVQAGSDSGSLSSLNKRNRVMLHSMDSLFGTGSFFVAVGAAHLGGDSGLIQLLRAHGYTVTPVTSARKIDPGSYVFQRQKDKDWVSVRVPDDGYEIALPGAPQDIPIDGGVSLKAYIDITNNSFFEAGAVPNLIKLTGGGKDSVLDVMAKEMAEKLHATVEKRTVVTQDSLQGLEVTMSSGEAALSITTRVFVSGKHVYVMALGYGKNARISAYTQDRFFGSLSVFAPEVRRERTYVASPVYYCAFTSPGKDVVRNVSPQTGYRGVYHTIRDPVTGNLFTVTMSRAQVGYELGDDSSALYNSLGLLKGSLTDSVVTSRDTVLLGRRALYVRGSGGGPSYRGVLIKRDNYQYKLLAFGQDDSLLQPEADSFFSSFRLLPFGDMPWGRRETTDSVFATQAPAYLMSWEKDGPHSTRWVDTVRMETYLLSDFPISPYAFSASDTGYLVKRFRQDCPTDDYHLTTHQGLPALTFIRKDTSKGHRLRGAYLLNGHKLYIQLAYVSPRRTGAPEVDRFFDSLECKEPASAYVLQKGPEKLLEDLHSPDSATKATAADYLDSAAFEEADLPQMLSSLLEKFPYDSVGGSDPSGGLGRAIRHLVSDKSLSLLGRTYRNLPDSLDDKRYDLLETVAGIQTRASFDSLLALLQYKLPATGDAYTLCNKIKDSLALARQICPGLMRFQADTLLGLHLFGIYNRLLDSGLMVFGDFAPVEKNALSFGYGYLLVDPALDEDFNGNFDQMTDFLKRFKDSATRAFFNAGCIHGSLPERFSSACGLQYMGYPAPAATLQTLAKDEYWRTPLYDSLKVYGRQRRFPQDQFTQMTFAKSYLAHAETGNDEMDDDIHPDIRFLRGGTYLFKGKKSTFLLFSVRYAGQDSTYLGVVGPYAPGSQQPVLKKGGDATGVYIQRSIDRAKLDAQVRRYLAGLSDTDDGTKP